MKTKNKKTKAIFKSSGWWPLLIAIAMAGLLLVANHMNSSLASATNGLSSAVPNKNQTLKTSKKIADAKTESASVNTQSQANSPAPAPTPTTAAAAPKTTAAATTPAKTTKTTAAAPKPAAAAPAAAPAPAPTASGGDIAPESVCPGQGNVGSTTTVLVCMTSYARTQHGLGPVYANTPLMAAAAAKADDIKNCGFSHTACGRDFNYWFSVKGYTGNCQAENIASGQATPLAVFTAWMNSEGHRENILNPTYNAIGVSVLSPGPIWVMELGGC